MKKTILFILFSLAGFAQNGVEIRLVNQSIGYPNYGLNGFYIANSSNDAGLNSIFETFSVSDYAVKGGHPYEDFWPRTMQVTCSCDENALTAALQNYSGVVEKAKVQTHENFSDVLIINLVNPTIGIPVSTNNNISITNDPGLNQIFEQFTIFYNQQAFPTAQDPNLQEYYWVVCDNCDILELKTALEAYTSVIETAAFAPAAYLLGTKPFEVIKTKVYPNPFKDSITIDTDKIIASYTLFDFTGKEIITTDSKTVFDTKISGIASGNYLLKLTQKDGAQAIQKIIKP